MPIDPPRVTPDKFSPARQAGVIATMAFAGLCAAFTQTIMLPIQGELPELLNAPASQTTWVVTVTLLASAIFVPITGKLGDMYGKRRVSLVMMMLLILGSALAAIGDGLTGVLIGRAFQGMSMGIIPLAMSLLRDVVSRERLGSSIAVVSATLGVGGALGLPLSATVTELFNWHMLFVFSGLLATICLAMLFFIVPPTFNRPGGKLDLPGAFGLTLGLTGLLLAVSRGNDWGWSSVPTLACVSVGLVSLLIWGWYELRVSNPLVDLRVSARPPILLTNLASVAMGFSLFASNVAFPQYLQLPEAVGGLGMTMLTAGFVLMPAGLVMLFAAPIAGRIERTAGPRVLLMLGAIVIAVAYAGCLIIPQSFWSVFILNTTIGLGIGLGYAAMPAQIMAVVPQNETAAANGLNALMRNCGTTIAAAVVGAILSAATPTTMLDSFSTVFALGLGASILCAVLAFFVPQRRDPKEAVASPATA